MKILTETYYDFKDVLIQPKRSNLCSRNQVDLEKTITFLHSKRTWAGVPILASNMDTTGTIEMYRELSKFKMITIFHKHYKLEDYPDDINGDGTLDVLKKTISLASRITGNDRGSLGLHPAIYFYGPTGRHSSAMFLGTASLLNEKLDQNNKSFFTKFTKVRCKLEEVLIVNKDLIATALQKHMSNKRMNIFKELLEKIVQYLSEDKEVSQDDLIVFSQLDGKLISGDAQSSNSRISEEQKSKLFINVALKNALTCPICGGYLDVEKSVSYDHIERVREGGNGHSDNVQLTHPYCNQTIKK